MDFGNQKLQQPFFQHGTSKEISGNTFYQSLYHELINEKNTENDQQKRCYKIKINTDNTGGNSNVPIKIYMTPKNKPTNVPNKKTRKNC